MKHPFKVGDVVYHFIHGESLVLEVDEPFLTIQTESDKAEKAVPRFLSFSPWPDPDWEAPLEDGWYIVRSKEEEENQWPQLARYGGGDEFEFASHYDLISNYEVIEKFDYTHVDEEEFINDAKEE